MLAVQLARLSVCRPFLTRRRLSSRRTELPTDLRAAFALRAVRGTIGVGHLADDDVWCDGQVWKLDSSTWIYPLQKGSASALAQWTPSTQANALAGETTALARHMPRLHLVQSRFALTPE